MTSTGIETDVFGGGGGSAEVRGWLRFGHQRVTTPVAVRVEERDQPAEIWTIGSLWERKEVFRKLKADLDSLDELRRYIPRSFCRVTLVFDGLSPRSQLPNAVNRCSSVRKYRLSFLRSY